MTVPATARMLLRGQLRQMTDWGFDVSVVSSPGPDLEHVRTVEQVAVHPLPMARDIETRADAVALGRLVRLFRRIRPHIVNASTPKAGLLGMVAARIARVPVRIYLLRGLRLETAQGGLSEVLGLTERLTCRCAHEVVCVSRSLETTYLERGYVSRGRTRVLLGGSSNGVDSQAFRVTDEVRERAAALRQSLGVPAGAPIVGFAGRPVEDKGIEWLVESFDRLRVTRPDTRLVLVGADLAGDGVPERFQRRITTDPNIRLLPFLADMAPFYGMIDVLAFPSLREGFPNVPIEAAAAEVPVVGFRSTGVVDAILDGVTGRIVDQRDALGLYRSIETYLADPALRRAHGAAGRAWVVREFDQRRIWEAWRDTYTRLLAGRGLPEPQPGADRAVAG